MTVLLAFRDQRVRIFPCLVVEVARVVGYWRLLAHHHLAVAKEPHEPEAPPSVTSIQGRPWPTPSLARRARISRTPQPRGRRGVTDIRGRWCSARASSFIGVF